MHKTTYQSQITFQKTSLNWLLQVPQLLVFPEMFEVKSSSHWRAERFPLINFTARETANDRVTMPGVGYDWNDSLAKMSELPSFKKTSHYCKRNRRNFEQSSHVVILVNICGRRRRTLTNRVPREILWVALWMSCHVTVWVPSWTGWHILPRSHAFNFSRLRTGIYFVTLVHRWNIILGDSGAISRVGRAFIAPFLPTRPTAPGSPRMSHPFNSVNFRWREATTGNTSEFAVQWVGFEASLAWPERVSG